MASLHHIYRPPPDPLARLRAAVEAEQEACEEMTAAFRELVERPERFFVREQGTDYGKELH